jgi:thioesterase domain-containing protein
LRNTTLKRLLAGETKVVDVPGAHASMLREPHVATLANVLRDALAAADPAPDAARARAEP